MNNKKIYLLSSVFVITTLIMLSGCKFFPSDMVSELLSASVKDRNSTKYDNMNLVLSAYIKLGTSTEDALRILEENKFEIEEITALGIRDYPDGELRHFEKVDVRDIDKENKGTKYIQYSASYRKEFFIFIDAVNIGLESENNKIISIEANYSDS